MRQRKSYATGYVRRRRQARKRLKKQRRIERNRGRKPK